MRIAVFTDTYFPTVDGVVRTVSTMKRELTKMGHECLIFAPAAQGERSHRTDDVIYCKSMKFKLYPEYSLPIFPCRIGEMIKADDIDIIHSHAIAFMALRALNVHNRLGTPLVSTYHTRVSEALEYYNIPFSSAVKRVLSRYMRIMLSRSDRITTPSDQTAEELLSIGVDSITIPGGVDLDIFKPTKEDRLGLHEIDGFKVLLAGRLAHEKNLDLFVESAKVLEEDNCHFIIMGRGPVEEVMKNKVKRLGLGEKFTFLGFVADADLSSVYSRCDLFATPSLFETMGLVMLEGLACNLPGIAPQGTCFEEYLPRECLFRPDPEGMAKHILSFKEGKVKLSNPRKIASKFSARRCAEHMVEVYSECIGERTS